MSLVSVIIPVYNAQDTLRRCLDSVINQTHKDLQIIVINDGSTDGSMEIAKQYPFKILDCPHSGVSQARNKGLEVATGEYIYFMDADDYFITCEAIASLFKYSADLVIEGAINLVNDYLLRPNKNIAFAFVWGKLFKQSIIREHCIRFNELMRKHEDTEFVFHYLQYAKTLAFTGSNNYVHNRLLSGAGMEIFDSSADCERLLVQITQFGMPQFLINHCRISLKIVEIIRAYRLTFMEHYCFIIDLLDNLLIRHSLKSYKTFPGNSKIIPFLIRHRLYLLLTFVCRTRGRKRYG